MKKKIGCKISEKFDQSFELTSQFLMNDFLFKKKQQQHRYAAVELYFDYIEVYVI